MITMLKRNTVTFSFLNIKCTERERERERESSPTYLIYWTVVNGDPEGDPEICHSNLSLSCGSHITLEFASI